MKRNKIIKVISMMLILSMLFTACKKDKDGEVDDSNSEVNVIESVIKGANFAIGETVRASQVVTTDPSKTVDQVLFMFDDGTISETIDCYELGNFMANVIVQYSDGSSYDGLLQFAVSEESDTSLGGLDFSDDNNSVRDSLNSFISKVNNKGASFYKASNGEGISLIKLDNFTKENTSSGINRGEPLVTLTSKVNDTDYWTLTISHVLKEDSAIITENIIGMFMTAFMDMFASTEIIDGEETINMTEFIDLINSLFPKSELALNTFEVLSSDGSYKTVYKYDTFIDFSMFGIDWLGKIKTGEGLYIVETDESNYFIFTLSKSTGSGMDIIPSTSKENNSEFSEDGIKNAMNSLSEEEKQELLNKIAELEEVNIETDSLFESIISNILLGDYSLFLNEDSQQENTNDDMMEDFNNEENNNVSSTDDIAVYIKKSYLQQHPDIYEYPESDTIFSKWIYSIGEQTTYQGSILTPSGVETDNSGINIAWGNNNDNDFWGSNGNSGLNKNYDYGIMTSFGSFVIGNSNYPDYIVDEVNSTTTETILVNNDSKYRIIACMQTGIDRMEESSIYDSSLYDNGTFTLRKEGSFLIQSGSVYPYSIIYNKNGEEKTQGYMVALKQNGGYLVVQGYDSPCPLNELIFIVENIIRR